MLDKKAIQIVQIPVVFFGQTGVYDAISLLHRIYKKPSDRVYRNTISGLLKSTVCKVAVYTNPSTITGIEQLIPTDCDVLLFTTFKDFNLTCARIVQSGYETDTKHSLKLIAVIQSTKVLYELGLRCIDVNYSKASNFVFKYKGMPKIYKRLKYIISQEIHDYHVSDFGVGLKRHNDYIREVVHKVKQGSFITPFMTFIYRLPYSTHQKPVKNMFLNWLFYSGDNNHMYAAVKLLEKHNPVFKLSARVTKALDDALFLPNIRQYAQAFADLRDNPSILYRDLVKTYRIDTYEINYIVSIINSERIMLTHDNGEELTFEDFFNRCISDKLSDITLSTAKEL